jgi:hypothetical protein
MLLPASNNLPVNLLAACFNNTSATYKYYWFLSILQEVEKGKTHILKKDLFARMISNAWFTVNYFHVSFGKQDLIQNTIHSIYKIENITIDEKQEFVFQKLCSTNNLRTVQHLWHFNRNVPHWFLSPWFPRTDMSEIYRLSLSFNNACLYALNVEFIMVNPKWIDYLSSNVKILKDFCYWNLALFLQAKNPNVPDIPNKLIKPATRNNLNKQRIQFWDVVLQEVGSMDCIYTGKPLTIGNYAVEHFIPYSFVSHDLIWNLIPAEKSFNSSKSNKLPSLDKYFSSFYQMQKTALDIINHKSPKNKFLQDYYTIFPDFHLSVTYKSFKERIEPMIAIASNNGFEFL